VRGRSGVRLRLVSLYADRSATPRCHQKFQPGRKPTRHGKPGRSGVGWIAAFSCFVASRLCFSVIKAAAAGRRSDRGQKSIAVLPAENRAREKQRTNFFTDGVRDGKNLTDLSQIADLK